MEFSDKEIAATTKSYCKSHLVGKGGLWESIQRMANILSLYGYCLKPPALVFMSNGSLYDNLHNLKVM